MRRVNLLNVKIEGFRSFISDEVAMPQDPGLRLLTGANNCEPRLGANGAGKSSFWRAVEWCVQGQGRISAYINWQFVSVSVETMWQSGDGIYNIKRYGPPVKIEINGKEATQADIDLILGLDKTRFANSVIFGQNAQLFPDKTINERGELLDQVLSLNLWQTAATKAAEASLALENQLEEKKLGLAYAKGKLNALPTVESLNKKKEEWDTRRQYEFKEIEAQIESWRVKQALTIKACDAEISNWEVSQQAQITTLSYREEKWKEEIVAQAELAIQELNNAEAKLAFLKSEVEHVEIGSPKLIKILETQAKEFPDKLKQKQAELSKLEFEIQSCTKATKLWENDQCPTCKQDIAPGIKSYELHCIERAVNMLSEKKAVAAKEYAELEKQAQSCSAQLDNLRASFWQETEDRNKQFDEIRTLTNKVANLEHEAQKLVNSIEGSNPYTDQIALIQKQVNPFIRRKEELLNEANPFIAQLHQKVSEVNPYESLVAKNEEERNIITAELSKLQHEYDTFEASMLATQYWKNGFKRIRLFFIQQILGSLQIEIQAAIDSLGLTGWKVQLTTESLTKSETVKLGVQIHITSPQGAKGEWSIWSGGEAQRLRRAIAIGVASLIQRAAGVYYPLEVWDEPTAGLSPEGVEDLLETLQYRAEVLGKQVWVVDHSALTYAGFSEIWSAQRDNKSGTKIVKISEAA